ncbi:MAG TPA: MerR family transcriptional regulator [Gammaproteobacteria bacterium]|nr:MerR family transcriptional regulator [Gammaproteobacteria bacterium]
MMLTVNELATKSHVTANAVRYYTRRGLLHPQRNPDNDYRLYRSDDAQRLHFIQQAKSLGFTLKEIEEILQQVSHGESACPLVRQHLKERIEENKKQIDDLVALQQRMEYALAEWQFLPNLKPDSEHLCHLIEVSGACGNAQESGARIRQCRKSG